MSTNEKNVKQVSRPKPKTFKLMFCEIVRETYETYQYQLIGRKFFFVCKSMAIKTTRFLSCAILPSVYFWRWLFIYLFTYFFPIK